MDARGIYEKLTAAGATPAGACGLMGNLYAESGLRFNALENLCRIRLREYGKGEWSDEAYTAAVDDGTISREEFLHPLPGRKYGYGLCQLTTPSRKAGLYDFCKSKGVSIADPDAQIEWLLLELRQSYKAVWGVLTATGSVREASDVVLDRFECPADCSESVREKRAGYGQGYYDEFAMTAEKLADKVIAIAMREIGYLEKASDKDLYNKTANAGSANYTKYGKEMHALYPSVMDYPAAWCDAFVDWCFYTAFGVCNAKGLLGGDFDDYTPNSANLYKKKDAWYNSDPQPGDQIFFKNETRICHTGLVIGVENGYVMTVEGNTSNGSEVIANGGAVCAKKYKLSNSRIAGYGRPAYDVASGHSPIKEGWVKAADGVRWWYQNADGSFPHNDGSNNGWALIDGSWFAFDSDGYMLTGFYNDRGNLYYLNEEAGSPDEGKLMTTYGNDKGYLTPWKVE